MAALKGPIHPIVKILHSGLKRWNNQQPTFSLTPFSTHYKSQCSAFICITERRETRCCLQHRNNEQVFKYWLWLWKRHVYFTLTSGQGWTLMVCLLCRCSADLGCFSWNYPSVHIIFWQTLNNRKRDAFYSEVCVEIPASQSVAAAVTYSISRSVLWATVYKVLYPYMTQKGIHSYLNSVRLLYDCEES